MRVRALAIPLLLIFTPGLGAQAAPSQDPPSQGAPSQTAPSQTAPSQTAPSQDEIPVFGTTVVLPSGLKGQVYNLKSGTSKLPNFAKLKPVGVIYTNSLNIPPREFTSGFPGVTDRFEWFGIDYTGRFWVEKPGDYTFRLLSDDGSILYIDDRMVIDNDGGHVPVMREGPVTLAGGIHDIRISYFQGRRFRLALVLTVKGPGSADFKTFSTEDFKPPAHPEDWKFGGEKDLDKAPKKKP
jgi:hypothetical protein